MAKFGWAYVNCSGAFDGGSGSAGPNGSLQFVTASGPGHTTGSVNLVYYTSSYGNYTANSMVLSGNLHVSGTISASFFHVKDIAIIDATGSTYFGDSNDDMHVRTGSLVVSNVAGNLILSTSIDEQATYVRGFGGNYWGVTALAYTVAAGDYLLGVQRGNYVTMSLPRPLPANKGRILLIKDEFPNRGTGSIFITGAGDHGFHIDNLVSYVMTGSNPAISLYSNGSDWFVF
jgi:hypothetical protein